MKVLITGGAGYIGSHTSIALAEDGIDVCIYDNFSANTEANINRVEKLLNKKLEVIKGDVRNTRLLTKSLKSCDCVLHLAAKKIAGESEKIPLEYFDNNVSGLISVLRSCKTSNVKKIVFASTAHIYGSHSTRLIKEDTTLTSDNTYGLSKKICEDILSKLKPESLDVVCLRYFNIAGAHTSGMLGDILVPPQTLLAKMCLAIAGKRIFTITEDEFERGGKKYMKDYVHIQDVAEANVEAVKFISENYGKYEFNIGTGIGTSIFQFIRIFESTTGLRFKYETTKGSPADTESTIASTKKSNTILGWQAKRTAKDIVSDLWRWYLKEYG